MSCGVAYSPHSTTPTPTPTSSRGSRCRCRGMRALRHTTAVRNFRRTNDIVMTQPGTSERPSSFALLHVDRQYATNQSVLSLHPRGAKYSDEYVGLSVRSHISETARTKFAKCLRMLLETVRLGLPGGVAIRYV